MKLSDRLDTIRADARVRLKEIENWFELEYTVHLEEPKHSHVIGEAAMVARALWRSSGHKESTAMEFRVEWHDQELSRGEIEIPRQGQPIVRLDGKTYEAIGRHSAPTTLKEV